ncbi:MAG: hypothetical protein Q8Q46_00080 [Candidatus Giovannonibacteria bacterium]|nr:hypothetical protein [Candidatus Giovannonibacteria bacterium]
MNQENPSATVEKVEFLPYFPTDLERAKSGFEKFNEVFENSKILKKIAEKDKFFKDKLFFVSIGLMPETGFYGGGGFQELDTEGERKKLKRIYEEELGLKTLHWQRFDESEKWDTSLFNPESVEKVIKNCPIPDLFPEEAKKDPMEWVLNNPNEWADLNDPKYKARFGVMSGYPPYGSSVYFEYKKAATFVDEALVEREKKAYYKYANSPRENREFPKNLEKRFSEAIKHKELLESRAGLLKNWFSYRGKLEFFGDGFSDEDEKYFENIKKIFDELDIDYKQVP